MIIPNEQSSRTDGFGSNVKLQPAMVNINYVVEKPVKSAKSLGVPLDDELKLVKHVAPICRSSYYQIRQLKHIRRYLDFDLNSTLVHTFATSRIDYCNALLASAPAYQMDQLQRVLNAAAAMMLHVSRFYRDLRIKVMDKLHWRPVPKRVTYKLCTLVYKSWFGPRIPCGDVHPCRQRLLPSKSPIKQIRTSYRPQGINFHHMGRDRSALQVHRLGTLSHNICGMINHITPPKLLFCP